MTVFSKQQRLLFVHVPKTAGSSILDLLRQTIDWDDYEYKLPKHAPVDILKRRLRDWYNKCHKFTVVRNPWERVASAYFFKLNNDPKVEQCDFATFVQQPETLKCIRSNGQSVALVDQPVLKPHTFFLCDKRGLAVDTVLRFETLEQDWNRFCIQHNLAIDYADLPSTNRQNREQYRGLFTSELIEIVRQRYREDIELFGYEFPSWLGQS